MEHSQVKRSACVRLLCAACFQPRKVQRATKTRHTLVDVRVKGGEMALTKSSSAAAQRESKMNRQMDAAQADASLCEMFFDPRWTIASPCELSLCLFSSARESYI